MKEFDESKVKRDKKGQFAEKSAQLEKKYNDDINNLVADEINKRNQVDSPNIEDVFGEEIKGYKGQDAVEKLLKEKRGHIKGAFYREDMGSIDLVWGNEHMGLQHIIERRTEQGINVETFLNDITDVIEKGNFRKKNNRGNFEFIYNGKIAVIAPEFKEHKITYLLTAFKTHSKK